MEHLLNEIEKALKFGLYEVALVSSLALPDICGALESVDGIATGRKYKDWYNTYAKKRASSVLSSDDCYLLRCSMLHQGKTIPSPQGKQVASYSKVVFTVPNPFLSAHDNILNDAANLQLDWFCKGMIEAVREWKQKMETEKNPNYLTNYRSLVRFHANGLHPYFTGVPVIASSD